MIDDYEVQVRKICPAHDCVAGRVRTDNMKFPGIHCSVCEGKGFIYEWKDLVTLIQQMIKVG